MCLAGGGDDHSGGGRSLVVDGSDRESGRQRQRRRTKARAGETDFFVGNRVKWIRVFGFIKAKLLPFGF